MADRQGQLRHITVSPFATKRMTNNKDAGFLMWWKTQTSLGFWATTQLESTLVAQEPMYKPDITGWEETGGHGCIIAPISQER